jgi:hypothetical protein
VRRAAFVAIVLVAVPLSASWWPRWSAESIELVVGQTGVVQVQAHWSGLVDYGNGIHWTFRSDTPAVAGAWVRVEDEQVYDVPIIALSPGYAVIREQTTSGALIDPSWVTIHVICGDEQPIRAAATELRGRIREPLALGVLSEIAARTQFTWYLGRKGDITHRLPDTGPRIAFTPSAYGTQYVWVSARTTCSESTAEFRIDVPARVRAVSPR